MIIPNFRSSPPPPPLPLGDHKSLLYICDLDVNPLFLPDLICSRFVKTGSCEAEWEKAISLESKHMAQPATPPCPMTRARPRAIPASITSSGRWG